MSERPISITLHALYTGGRICERVTVHFANANDATEAWAQCLVAVSRKQRGRPGDSPRKRKNPKPNTTEPQETNK